MNKFRCVLIESRSVEIEVEAASAQDAAKAAHTIADNFERELHNLDSDPWYDDDVEVTAFDEHGWLNDDGEILSGV